MRLTELEVHHARPADTTVKLLDGKGLYLAIAPSGVKTWHLQCGGGGTNEHLDLGQYPVVSLAAARESQRLVLQLLGNGRQARSEFQLVTEPGRQTFEVIARAWCDHKRLVWEHKQTTLTIRRLEKYAFAPLGKMNIQAISSPLVLSVIKMAEDRGALCVSERLLANIRAIFRFAIANGWTNDNPADALREALMRRQSWLQTVVLLLVFVAMAVPLGISLNTIGREAVAVSQVRSLLTEKFGDEARVTQLDLDFAAEPLVVRAVVITPRSAMQKTPMIQTALEETLGRPVRLDLDQILLEAGAGALEAQREELRQAGNPNLEAQRMTALAKMIALVTGIPADDVTIDRDHRRATAAAVPLPGATVATYHALESRAAAETEGWSVVIVPPQGPLPEVAFADNVDTLDAAARASVVTSIWAARRWNMPALGVPGLPQGTPPTTPNLTVRRALAIAALMRAQNVVPVAAPPAGQRFALVTGVTATAP